MKRYRLTVNEKQLIGIEMALEEYFRLRMGQDMDFSDAMAQIETDLSHDNPNFQKNFERFLERRDALRAVMKAFFNIAFQMGYLRENTEEMLIAEDIWDSIRVARGRSRWGSALNVSGEPLPKIEEIEE